MRKLTVVSLLLCVVAIFAAPHFPNTVGIKVIEEKSPAPKDSIMFTILQDSYTEESKQVKYEEYGITWLYTMVRLDVFKTASEVRSFYKLTGTFIKKNLESGDILLTSGNRAEFKLITISPRSNFCLVTLEHVRPTPEALQQLRLVSQDSAKPAAKPAAKSLIEKAQNIIRSQKPKVVRKKTVKRRYTRKTSMKNTPVKKDMNPKQTKVIPPKVKTTTTKPAPADIINPPTNNNITPVKKKKTEVPTGVKKVVPKSTKPATPVKKTKPFFEG